MAINSTMVMIPWYLLPLVISIIHLRWEEFLEVVERLCAAAACSYKTMVLYGEAYCTGSFQAFKRSFLYPQVGGKVIFPGVFEYAAILAAGYIGFTAHYKCYCIAANDRVG